VKEAVVQSASKRYTVFSIRDTKGGTMWIKAGAGWQNRDGSFNINLDVLPLNGRLHVRDAAERHDPVPMRPETPPLAPEPVAVGAP
jgi:hypothetical protein